MQGKVFIINKINSISFRANDYQNIKKQKSELKEEINFSKNLIKGGGLLVGLPTVPTFVTATALGGSLNEALGWSVITGYMFAPLVAIGSIVLGIGTALLAKNGAKLAFLKGRENIPNIIKNCKIR